MLQKSLYLSRIFKSFKDFHVFPETYIQPKEPSCAGVRVKREKGHTSRLPLRADETLRRAFGHHDRLGGPLPLPRRLPPSGPGNPKGAEVARLGLWVETRKRGKVGHVPHHTRRGGLSPFEFTYTPRDDSVLIPSSRVPWMTTVNHPGQLWYELLFWRVFI